MSELSYKDEARQRERPGLRPCLDTFPPGRAGLKRPPGSELSLAGFGWPLVNFPVTLTRPSVS
jgi:hypothetical protein